MADQNDSPALWGSGNIGVLKLDSARLGRVLSYQLTPYDCVVLGVMCRFEEYYPYLALWALIQAFAGRSTNRPQAEGLHRSSPDSLARYGHSFSAPINPAFAYTGTPSPSRATRGTNCATLNGLPAGRYSGTGGGSLPPAGNHQIPPRPSSNTWNRVMCSGGRVPSTHGNDGQNTARIRRFDAMRTMLFGGSDSEKSSAWRDNTSVAVRTALWNIVHGQAGNPIPGFDNWAACWAIAGKNRRIIIPDLSATEQEEALSLVRSQTPSQRRSRPLPVRFGAAMTTRVREGFGPVSRSNCFLYHSYLRDGDEAWIEWNSGDRIYDTRRAQVDMSHFERGEASDVRVASGVPGGGGNQGGMASTTPEGLAPTEQRPAGVPNGSISVPSSLGRKEDLYRQLEEWSLQMERTLDREVGRGVVRR